MFVWKRICVYVAIVACLFFAFSGEVRAEKLPPPDLLSLTPEITSLEAPIDIQGVDFWTWRGPRYNLAAGAAPQVTTVVLDPNNSDIVYAGTNQGVYRSADGGESWQPRNGGLGGYGDLVITGIAIDPTDSRILIIGTWGYGLLKSTDSGANWTRLGDPVRPTALAGVEEGLSLPPEVIAGGPSNVYYPEAAERNEIAAPISWQRTAVRCVTINPSNRNDIYACVDDGYGLYRSTNGGTSWSKITLGTGSARTYTFAPSNNNVRYASFGTWTASGGFYRSTNGGSTWTAVGGGVINNTVIAVAIHPTNANTVVVGTSGGGLYRTTDGGNTWTAVNTGVSDTTIYSVAISKSNPSIVYAGGYMWVYRSSNGGASWANADSSFPAYYVEGLAIHPTSSDRVWIGINRFPWGGVYKRTTSTGAFTLKGAGMDGTFVLDVTQDLNNANTLYAATWGAGMFRSYDRGATWSAIYGVPYVYSIEATQGPTGTILYAGTFYSDWGVLKSWNQGNTWYEVSWSNPSYISFDIESIQGNTNKLVAATYNGIQYSNDGGVTWATPTGLTEGIVLHLCEFGNTGQLLAATYGGGLYYSNGGTSWAPRTSGMTGSYANYTYDVACSLTSGVAYAGAYQAYRTTNYGANWTAMNTGLANDYVRALAIAPTGAVFAGLNTGGAYLAPAGTTTWHAINTGLGERRVRSMAVVASSPVKALAGTNGAGIWEYTLVRGYPPVYLPLVLRSYPQIVLPTKLYPVADATVLQGYSGTNFGAVLDMWVGYDNCLSPTGKISRSLVRFDLSAIPAGTSISSARLYLYLTNSCDIGERTHTATVYRITSSWSEGTVTWNSSPTFAEAYGSRSIPSRTWGWYNFDVTNLVRGWVNGSFSNYGMMVRGPESSDTSGARLGFVTRESSGTTYDPYLSITYTSMTGVETTVEIPLDFEPTESFVSIHTMLQPFSQPCVDCLQAEQWQHCAAHD